jgi:hypothetical protein
MEIAFALDVSETVSTETMARAKDFVTEVIRTYASSENDVHFAIMTYAGMYEKDYSQRPVMRENPRDRKLEAVFTSRMALS